MKKVVYFLFLLLFCSVRSGWAEQAVTVRVAFFPMAGFHQFHSVTGNPMGYDVDYLNRIHQYTRWKIEYVPVNTWDEALQALEGGTVDLVGSAQLTPERMQRFSYSAAATGHTRSAMVAPQANDNLVFEDFEAFNGLRVGVVQTWMRRQEFLDFARSRGFQPRMQEFDSTAQMREALRAGTIDAMVMNIMEQQDGEKRLAEFMPAPFFYLLRKNDSALKSALDEALGSLQLAQPGLSQTLMEKWYPKTLKTPYSRVELDYLDANPEMTMSLLVNRPPFSQLQEGELRFEGIVPDVLRLISKESGLRFVLSPLILSGSPADLIAEGKACAVAGVGHFDAQLQDTRVVTSEVFFTSPLVLLGKAERPFQPHASSIVAVPKGYFGGKSYLARTFPGFTVLEIPGNGRDCMEAVRVGRADYALVNPLGVGPSLRSPRYADLEPVPGVGTAERLALLLPANVNPLLLSILNKSIRNLEEGDIQRLTAAHSLAMSYQPTLNDFLLQYRKPVLFILPLLCIALLTVVGSAFLRNRTWRLVQEREETLRSVTNTIQGGVVTLSLMAEYAIVYANAGFWQLLGLPEETPENMENRSFLLFLHPDDAQLFTARLNQQPRDGSALMLELRLRHSSGRDVPVLLRGTTATDVHGTLLVYCVLVDSTEQHEMIERLEVEKERFRILVDQSNDILFEYDAENQILSCSPRFRQTFGRMPRMGGLRELQLHPDDEVRLLDLVHEIVCSRQNAVIRVRIADATGRWLWCRVFMACIVRNDLLVRVVGRIENIDPEVQEVQRLEALSQRDPLCGLLNRAAFQKAVEARLADLPEGSGGALFFIDLDNFKAVNDSFGHLEGDKALVDVAHILMAFFRTADLVGRYGGDEFCVFVPEIPQETAVQKAAGLVQRLRRVYGADTPTPVHISASMGVSMYPRNASCYEELVRTADAAAYRAKVRGKSQFVLCDDVAHE